MGVNSQDILCESYLKIIYQHAKIQSETKIVSETYGEILPIGIDKLLSVISLSEQDIFFDLGSGLGKLALQVFFKSRVKEVYGIELLSNLHQQALIAAGRVLSELPGFYEGNRKLSFIHDSFLNVPMTNANVILVSSPCFSPDTMHKLARKVEELPDIHTVLTMRPMSGLRRLSFRKSIRIECSWDSALCYLYTK